MTELQKPISLTIEDIIRDMYKYVKDFPIKVIPHIIENEDYEEINDIIHNYKRKNRMPMPNLANTLVTGGITGKNSQTATLTAAATLANTLNPKKKNNLALEQAKPNLYEKDI